MLAAVLTLSCRAAVWVALSMNEFVQEKVKVKSSRLKQQWCVLCA